MFYHDSRNRYKFTKAWLCLLFCWFLDSHRFCFLRRFTDRFILRFRFRFWSWFRWFWFGIWRFRFLFRGFRFGSFCNLIDRLQIFIWTFRLGFGWGFFWFNYNRLFIRGTIWGFNLPSFLAFRTTRLLLSLLFLLLCFWWLICSLFLLLSIFHLFEQISNIFRIRIRFLILFLFLILIFWFFLFCSFQFPLNFGLCLFYFFEVSNIFSNLFLSWGFVFLILNLFLIFALKLSVLLSILWSNNSTFKSEFFLLIFFDILFFLVLVHIFPLINDHFRNFISNIFFLISRINFFKKSNVWGWDFFCIWDFIVLFHNFFPLSYSSFISLFVVASGNLA